MSAFHFTTFLNKSQSFDDAFHGGDAAAGRCWPVPREHYFSFNYTDVEQYPIALLPPHGLLTQHYAANDKEYFNKEMPIVD